MNTGASRAVAAVFAIFSVQAAHAQVADTGRVPDTTRRVVDTTKQVDSGRKAADSVGVIVGSPKKSVSAPRAGQVARAEVSGGEVTIPAVDGPVRLAASLSEKTLTVMAGDNAIKTFRVAVGTTAKPTPTGSFKIRKIVWNPSWIPPNEPWAKGKTAQGPGEPGNPMKVAKIFFQEPDYYIHGTGQVNSLGTADSHGCLRMSPDEVAALAKFLMEHGGNAQEEGWFSRVIHLRWQTHTVTLDKPIALTISEYGGVRSAECGVRSVQLAHSALPTPHSPLPTPSTSARSGRRRRSTA